MTGVTTCGCSAKASARRWRRSVCPVGTAARSCRFRRGQPGPNGSRSPAMTIGGPRYRVRAAEWLPPRPAPSPMRPSTTSTPGSRPPRRPANTPAGCSPGPAATASPGASPHRDASNADGDAVGRAAPRRPAAPAARRRHPARRRPAARRPRAAVRPTRQQARPPAPSSRQHRGRLPHPHPHPRRRPAAAPRADRGPAARTPRGTTGTRSSRRIQRARSPTVR